MPVRKAQMSYMHVMRHTTFVSLRLSRKHVCGHSTFVLQTINILDVMKKMLFWHNEHCCFTVAIVIWLANVTEGNTDLMYGARTPHERSASIVGVRFRRRYSASKPSTDSMINTGFSNLHTTLFRPIKFQFEVVVACVCKSACNFATCYFVIL